MRTKDDQRLLFHMSEWGIRSKFQVKLHKMCLMGQGQSARVKHAHDKIGTTGFSNMFEMDILKEADRIVYFFGEADIKKYVFFFSKAHVNCTAETCSVCTLQANSFYTSK